MSRRAEVTAVHEDEVHDLLSRLGLGESYADGSLKCSLCARPIRDEGIGAIRKVDGELLVSCGRLECVEDISG